MKTKIGVLVSGGGSNLQSIIDSCENGILKNLAEVAVVISNKADAFALERAKSHKITGIFIDRKKFADAVSYCNAIAAELKKYNIDFICLAGFLLKLEPVFIKEFSGKILNIHPALLPKFGGKGMYGHYVHEAVITAGEKESGATVHYVDEEYDHGKIIIQKKVSISNIDTPVSLAQKVLKVEHEIYQKAIKAAIEKEKK